MNSISSASTTLSNDDLAKIAGGKNQLAYDIGLGIGRGINLFLMFGGSFKGRP